jgi:Na+/melibiose symporter-like transporter
MLPFIAYAADNVDSLLYRLNDKVINPLIEFAFIIALVVFLFGVMEFIRGAGNEEKRTKGKQHMLWGIVGFLVMFGVFGIINLIIGTFSIQGVTVTNKEQKVEIPCIQDLQINGENIGSLVPCATK